jgi:hypothetical protein
MRAAVRNSNAPSSPSSKLSATSGFGNVVFRPASLEYQDWLNTTWLELQDAALIDDEPSSFAETKYQLTPRGWLVGLRMSGALASPAIVDRAGRLAGALKSHVKGRGESHDGLATFIEIVQTTGLPEGWVFNALTAGLLEEMFPSKVMRVRIENGVSPSIWIPQTFGLNRL